MLHRTFPCPSMAAHDPNSNVALPHTLLFELLLYCMFYSTSSRIIHSPSLISIAYFLSARPSSLNPDPSIVAMFGSDAEQFAIAGSNYVYVAICLIILFSVLHSSGICIND